MIIEQALFDELFWDNDWNHKTTPHFIVEINIDFDFETVHFKDSIERPRKRQVEDSCFRFEGNL